MPDLIFSLTFPEKDIALLTLDVPNKGANVLSQPVLEDLSRQLDALTPRKDLAGLVIRSGKPGTFIAGADLREFAAAKNVTEQFTIEMCTRGRKLFQRLSQCPFVTVAAIDGICLGGGTELALWCDRRIMTGDPKTLIGLPEVKLGLFPGWGGTARLPRMIGLSNAVELISGGEPIDGKAAASMNLASDIVTSERLLPAAVALVRAEQQSGQYKLDRERWSGPIDISETELMFLGATGSAYIQQQTKGQYPAPLAALEVMLTAAGVDVDAACQMEAEGMANLFGTPINRALINVFFLADRNKKDPGVDGADLKPRPIGSVGVVGAGIMGSSIAAVCAKRMPVSITDVSPEGLAKGVRIILEEVSYNKALKGPDVKKAFELAPRINATTTDAELAACDLIIEAVVENEKAKKELFARIEPLLKDDTILASNTSTIPIEKLAADLKRPERFCGIHFFNPVRKMPLVEVIRGPKTSDQTVAAAVGFAKAVGKSPVVVYDGPGFLVNRALFPYLSESLELILDGVPIDQIERCAKSFGMPMGPITLYDVIGLDTAFYAGKVMYEAFPDRCLASPLMVAMVGQEGRLGQKTGAGFFSYKENKERGRPDPTLQPILDRLVRKPQKLSDEQVTHRLFLPMLLEATRILEEKKVRDPRDVDLALIYGIGFPPHKGGLLFWADQIGAAKIVELLKPLAHLGPRTEPTPLLLEMAKSGQRFYSTV